MTMTLCPARASSYAVERPAIPEPTTTLSQVMCFWRRGARGTPFSSIQSDRVSAPLAFIFNLTVDLSDGHKLAGSKFDPHNSLGGTSMIEPPKTGFIFICGAG